MGQSTPTKKERMNVCERCPSQCHSYLFNGGSYSPQRQHKAQPLHLYCISYDHLGRIKLNAGKDILSHTLVEIVEEEPETNEPVTLTSV